MAKRISSAKKSNTVTKYHPYISWSLLALAALLLLLAQGSAWVKNTLFDQADFKSIAITTLSQQQNRDAIASKVVDTALQDRPIIKRIAGDRLSAFTSGLLASDFGERVLDGVVSKMYGYVTNPNPKDVELQLTVIKQPLSILTQIAQTYDADIKLEADAIPDTLVLVRANEVPNVSGIYRSFIWLAPLFWLLTLAAFASYLYINRKDYAKHVYRVYGAIIIVVVIGLSTGPFVPQSVGALLADANTSQLVTNLVSAYLAPFTQQMWTMAAIASVAVIIFSQRQRIVTTSQSLLAKLPNQKAKK